MQAPRRLLSGLQQLRPAARAVCPGPKTCRRFLSAPGGAPRPSPMNKTDPKSRWRLPRRSGAATVSLLASGGVVSLALGLSEPSKPAQDDKEHAPTDTDTDTDTRDPKLPRFRLSEVRQHDGKSDRPWVTHGDKVYDITDWVGAHPGGDVILRAAGGSIDPYWNIFTIHKAPHVYEILEQYQIGLIHSADLVDGLPAVEALEDPFRDDPARDPRLITLTVKPRNAETPLEELVENFITPNELFYVRNHMWVPQVDAPAAHTLTVELMDGTTKEYTLQDLKTRFKPVTITATLQCSGNRRRDMTLHSYETQGLQWNVGAISCAEWEGVKLADVLADAGFSVRDARDGNTDARHVQFAGLESYGASIPIEPAIDPRGDVILAYAMNGKPLPPDHGFPLRALVPGHVAARSVKWLNKIVVSDEESQSQWQRKDYKLFGPNVIHPDWESAPAIQEMPITSAIALVKMGDWVKPGPRAPTAHPPPPPSPAPRGLPRRLRLLGRRPPHRPRRREPRQRQDLGPGPPRRRLRRPRPRLQEPAPRTQVLDLAPLALRWRHPPRRRLLRARPPLLHPPRKGHRRGVQLPARPARRHLEPPRQPRQRLASAQGVFRVPGGGACGGAEEARSREVRA